MSRLIKSGDLADIRPLDPERRPLSLSTGAGLDARQEERDERIASFEAALADREKEIAALRAEMRRAVSEARAEGRRTGLAEAQDLQTDRLAALETEISEAKAVLERSLSSLDRLALLIARECIDTMAGESASRAGLLQDMVATQLAKIEKSAIIRIRLSKKDFPDDEALARLAERAGAESVALVADAAMPEGGCDMRLRLGRMEIGVDQQWGSMRVLLDEMAQPASAP